MAWKTRMWIGVTLLLILGFNYGIVGFPMMKRASYIKDKYRAILIKEAKSPNMLKSSDDEYMLEILRKEKTAIDRRIVIFNCIAISLSILLISWTVFGIVKSAFKGKT